MAETVAPTPDRMFEEIRYKSVCIEAYLRTPWWPIPFSVGMGQDQNTTTSEGTTVTTNATTATTTTPASTRTDTTTVMVAVTFGAQWSGTLVIVTIAVSFTLLGTFVSVRCVRRRRRRPSRPTVQEQADTPLQVDEVSSTSASPRRRRRREDSFESMELFAVKND